MSLIKSVGFGSGLSRLTDELAAVREAWHREGEELRHRLSDVQQSRLRAEESCTRMQVELRMKEDAWRARGRALEGSLRKAQLTHDAVCKEFLSTREGHAAEMASLKRELEVLQSEAVTHKSRDLLEHELVTKLESELALVKHRLADASRGVEEERCKSHEASAETRALQAQLADARQAYSQAVAALCAHDAETHSRLQQLQARAEILVEASCDAAAKTAMEATSALDSVSSSHAAAMHDASASAAQSQSHISDLEAAVRILSAENRKLRALLSGAEREFESVAEAAVGSRGVPSDSQSALATSNPALVPTSVIPREFSRVQFATTFADHALLRNVPSRPSNGGNDSSVSTAGASEDNESGSISASAWAGSQNAPRFKPSLKAATSRSSATFLMRAAAESAAAAVSHLQLGALSASAQQPVPRKDDLSLESPLGAHRTLQQSPSDLAGLNLCQPRFVAAGADSLQGYVPWHSQDLTLPIFEHSSAEDNLRAAVSRVYATASAGTQ